MKYSNETLLIMVYIYFTTQCMYFVMLEYIKTFTIMYNYGMLEHPIILKLLP